MKLYASDGVFMPQNFPSSIGAEAVRKAYDAVFGAITLSVKFMSPKSCKLPRLGHCAHQLGGHVKVNANGEGGPEANQELFAFQKVDGAWKIARYCFATTNPRAHKQAQGPEDDQNESRSDS